MTPGFTEQDLRDAADGQSFERGLGYLDAVSDLDVTAEEIYAVVQGTGEYEVVLTMGEDGIEGDCDCPYGQEGAFCKHCVAVGLTVLRHGRTLPAQRAAAAQKRDLLDQWLEALPREDLLELLREQIGADRNLRRSLELRAATTHGDWPTPPQTTTRRGSPGWAWTIRRGSTPPPSIWTWPTAGSPPTGSSADGPDAAELYRHDRVCGSQALPAAPPSASMSAKARTASTTSANSGG
jgi:SWIM zinc finger